MKTGRSRSRTVGRGKKALLSCAAICAFLGSAREVAAPQTAIDLVATSTALGDIAKQVGGDRLAVKTLAPPTQDIHFIEPKPTDILVLTRANFFLHSGLDLELWRGPLVEASSNPRVFPLTKGDIDASQGISPLQIPVQPVSRAAGDIHIFGNPHYWLDPLNGKVIAHTISRKLREFSPDFKTNLEAFSSQIDKKMEEWQDKLRPFSGAKLVCYHNSWIYFTERFGLTIVDYLEPKPNIPPSGAHLTRVVDEMKRMGVKVIVIEPFHPRGPAERVAAETGAEILVLPTHPGGVPGTETYTKMFDYIIDTLAHALARTADKER